MVRIKAKPLPRLPIAPGVSGAQMKNGYRQTPPPQQPAATAQIYDPAAAAAAAAYQQRIFLNTAIQPTSAVPASFGQQVQFFVSYSK